MKSFLLSAICITLICSFAAAQEFPRVEVFGGYSIQRIGIPGLDEGLGGVDVNDIIDSIDLPSGYELTVGAISTNKFLKKGFAGAVTFNINEYFGIEGTIRWNKGDVVTIPLTINSEMVSVDGEASVKYSDYAFLFGPHFAWRKNEKITPFAHVLVGFDRARLLAGAEAEGESTEMELDTDSGLGFALGGGLDIKASDSIAIRLIQADFYLTRHYEESFKNLNLAFGVVFMLGGK